MQPKRARKLTSLGPSCAWQGHDARTRRMWHGRVLHGVASCITMSQHHVPAELPQMLLSALVAENFEVLAT